MSDCSVFEQMLPLFRYRWLWICYRFVSFSLTKKKIMYALYVCLFVCLCCFPLQTIILLCKCVRGVEIKQQTLIGSKKWTRWALMYWKRDVIVTCNERSGPVLKANTHSRSFN